MKIRENIGGQKNKSSSGWYALIIKIAARISAIDDIRINLIKKWKHSD